MSKLQIIGIAAKIVITGGHYIVTLFCDAVNAALEKLSYETCESIGKAVVAASCSVRSIGDFCSEKWNTFWNAAADLISFVGGSISDRNLETVEAEQVWEYAKKAWTAFFDARKNKEDNAGSAEKTDVTEPPEPSAEEKQS